MYIYHRALEAHLKVEDSRQRQGSHMSDTLITLPAISIKGAVLFPIPMLTIPLTVTKSRTLAALERAMSEDELVLIVTQRDPESEPPKPDDLYHHGIVARVLELIKDDDEHQLLIEGLYRARATRFLESDEYLYAEALRLGVEVLIAQLARRPRPPRRSRRFTGER